jgi:hypothetical protein
MTQVVSHRLPTDADWLRSQLEFCRICGGESRIATGFTQIFRFSLPVLIPLTTPYSLTCILSRVLVTSDARLDWRIDLLDIQ